MTNKMHIEIPNGGIIVMPHFEVHVAYKQGNWHVLIFLRVLIYLFIYLFIYFIPVFKNPF